jgi:hypothetical protein
MKKAGAAVSILVALGTAALGQTPRTDIQGYYIGETFPEFAAQSGLDLAMCSGNELTKPQRRMCKNAACIGKVTSPQSCACTPLFEPS